MSKGFVSLQACVAGLIAGAIATAACGPAPARVSAVVYDGARVIVGDGTTIDDATMIIDEGRIAAIGPAGSVDVPTGATRVDLATRTVMPAIVDTHVHLGTDRASLLADLEARARFGVGAAMSLGSDTVDEPLMVRGEEGSGRARFLSAGSGITRPEPGRREVHWVDTVDEAREAVQDEAARDVDAIKIWVDDRAGQFEKLTPELYAAIIDEAHAHGLKVAAHIVTLEDAAGLVQAGVDIFAHGVRDRDVDDAFVQLVQAHPSLVLIPNLPSRGVPADVSWLEGKLPADQLEALRSAAPDPAAQETFGIQARNLARLYEAGMTIALGTDGNTAWAPHVEMEDMVAAGMPPGAVIVAATRNGAALLELDDMGTLEVGKSADFLVLEANPLDDITNTRRIVNVYLRGAEVPQASTGP